MPQTKGAKPISKMGKLLVTTTLLSPITKSVSFSLSVQEIPGVIPQVPSLTLVTSKMAHPLGTPYGPLNSWRTDGIPGHLIIAAPLLSIS